MEKNDPVIRRFPVYKSKIYHNYRGIKSELLGMVPNGKQVGQMMLLDSPQHPESQDSSPICYLMQYPTNLSRPESTETMEVKPNTHVFQRLLNLNRRYYSSDSGEKYGRAVRMHEISTGSRSGDSTLDIEGRLSRVFMKGTKIMNGNSRSGQFFMAVLRQRKFYFVPISGGIVQMRPELTHLDDMSKQLTRGVASKSRVSELGNESGSGSEAEAASSVANLPKRAALLKKSETASNNSAFQSRQKLIRDIEAEEWLPMKFRGVENTKIDRSSANS